MKKILCSLAVACAALCAPFLFAHGEIFPVWNGTPPGETEPPKSEKIRITKQKSGDERSITNVWTPTLEIFHAPAQKNTGTAVLICPGGGYGSLAYDHEGVAVARWFNTIGVTGVILKYRVPTRPKTQRALMPLKDAQRAISLIRANAKEWKINPARIGIMGFSAGGHLSALVSTTAERSYKPADAVDELPFRPNFTILVYPAYMTSKGDTSLAAEIKVGTDTPPAICVHASNDPYTSEGSLLYYKALKKAKVPAELHIYATGGHGFGMRPRIQPSKSWTAATAAWIESLKLPDTAKNRRP
ncbi:MAG: alpha/beta hydrolase [Puniceicoccales bacterium]|jgi:acetyl esterase/lipase|nr:alpha/beta hydrolase [Puniceicoccales bacterium]